MENLQTEEQRLVLDTVAQLRKCGLEGDLSLPQLVIYGDQSAGKSSVLEALTEISFPRNDKLCTRFATEIILCRATTESLNIKVIPGPNRSKNDQSAIRAFSASILDFSELPRIMAEAMRVMGIQDLTSEDVQGPVFAEDVLSVEIQGPKRPQLTLVDLPGLIQSKTKSTSSTDIEVVRGITQRYIAQPRTVCLAVVSATNDHANQPILDRVRDVDPEGKRALGIITKADSDDVVDSPERVKTFMELARNQDIFFDLGWHMLRNRRPKEKNDSLEQRNPNERRFFQESVFKELSPDTVGIDALRVRLSKLLFNHCKRELPTLRNDLESGLVKVTTELSVMGCSRATVKECRNFLTRLSMDCYDICRAALDGHYERDFFLWRDSQRFHKDSPQAVRRPCAMVQFLNGHFNRIVRERGHKYLLRFADDRATIPPEAAPDDEAPAEVANDRGEIVSAPEPQRPIKKNRRESLDWVRQALVRGRGREMSGDPNPLLIGELFWEQ